MTPDIEARTNMMTVDAQNREIDHLPSITSQQKVYVAARCGGLGLYQAAKQCGATREDVRRWERYESIQAWKDHYMEVHAFEVMPQVKFDKADAHGMYMEAYHLAATSGEKIKATDSLVKLHGLIEQPKEKPITASDIRHVKQLADLSLEQLARLAEMEDVIDGEVIDDEEGD